MELCFRVWGGNGVKIKEHRCYEPKGHKGVCICSCDIKAPDGASEPKEN